MTNQKKGLAHRMASHPNLVPGVAVEQLCQRRMPCGDMSTLSAERPLCTTDLPLRGSAHMRQVPGANDRSGTAAVYHVRKAWLRRMKRHAEREIRARRATRACLTQRPDCAGCLSRLLTWIARFLRPIHGIHLHSVSTASRYPLSIGKRRRGLLARLESIRSKA